ncbi:NRAMP family divalent metal transporter [Fundidesulfovibrio putealis]|uniref:NRAMP family divalent metal transporter n=1 Tax=Fundidesulfovibrio putealis TaxID=270496 RepID=UPI00040571C2|nr:divalent metal cation transporter [Fundidesulfovibrio putealis]
MKQFQIYLRQNQTIWEKLGPGLITGAADDDPSGIATYSQVGAAFGYGMLWTAFLTFPLMVGIQVVSANIGRVTGHGLAANIRNHYSPWLLRGLVGLLLLANTINIAADVGAMGAALKLLIGGPAHLYAIAFGVVSLVLQVFVPFPRYSPILKALTLALFAYVGTVFVVKVPWGEVFYKTIIPSVSFSTEYAIGVVAVFGTTISPYLFFWQASQEVEEQRAAKGEEPLKAAPEQARSSLHRIKVDSYVGMGFSNLVAFFIMLTAAVALHQHGVTDIQTSAQAAEALRPLAGKYAFWLFAAGIVGSGLLAVPILAGSAAYAVAEASGWPIGLGRQLRQARGFYMIVAVATLLGVALNFTPVDPIKALFLSAVINGVIAVPIMVVIMFMAARTDVMGHFVINLRLRILGWLATTVMAIAVLTMFVTWVR